MSNETNTQDVSARLVGVKDPTRDDHAATKKYVDDHGGGNSVDVTDGSTTVTGLTELDFTSGATVTDAGGGVAQVAVGGGSQPGAVRILKHAFDFSQAAALADGVPVWTPAVGDWLLGAWIETDAVWAGGLVSPFADIGVVKAGAWADVNGGPSGFFNRSTGAVDLTSANWSVDTELVSYSNATVQTDLAQASLIGFTAPGTGAVPMQVKWRTTDPLKVVVSSDGTPAGTPTDAASGASTLFVVVSTPAAP